MLRLQGSCLFRQSRWIFSLKPLSKFGSKPAANEPTPKAGGFPIRDNDAGEELTSYDATCSGPGGATL